MITYPENVLKQRSSVTYSDLQKAERKYHNVLAIRGHTVFNEMSAYNFEMQMYKNNLKAFHAIVNPYGTFDLNDIQLELCKGYHKNIKRLYKLMLLETSRIIRDELPIKVALEHKQYAEQVDRGQDPNDIHWQTRDGMKVGHMFMWNGKSYAKVLWS